VEVVAGGAVVGVTRGVVVLVVVVTRGAVVVVLGAIVVDVVTLGAVVVVVPWPRWASRALAGPAVATLVTTTSTAMAAAIPATEIRTRRDKRTTRCGDGFLWDMSKPIDGICQIVDSFLGSCGPSMLVSPGRPKSTPKYFAMGR
jgi:hypothetical protein